MSSSLTQKTGTALRHDGVDYGDYIEQITYALPQDGRRAGAASEVNTMTPLRPFFESVRAHYDLSNDFFRLFLDPTMTYSCAYFEREDMTLEQAQLAKIDLSLRKCDLRPGQRLLDVGCGWGSTIRRAADVFHGRAVGLTLSENQVREAAARSAGRRDIEIRLQGWEGFDEAVDRIVSIGALEHFRDERYDAFFERCRELLPNDGRMLIQSIVAGNEQTLATGEKWVDREFVRYTRFSTRRGIKPTALSLLTTAKLLLVTLRAC